MDFWSRLIGGAHTPKKPVQTTANDPEQRRARFQRVFSTIQSTCDRPRNLAAEGALLDQLHVCLERIAILIREETRAPSPHLCLQFAASKQIYTIIARVATVTRDERLVHGAVAVFSALLDSEEEDFLTNERFSKSLMRFISKVVDSGAIVVGVETETDIVELLFGIAAKIRLQPEILPFWFTSTARPELEDVFVKEKKNFVGITQKDDFPLCYILIDRVHHEGRIGDFARTGLLYIFEATGRSEDLEEWVISSDLPTLMASGLGALYSQLSRELSILHPDAMLPPVLAMSDYSTTHTRATAESVYSAKHLGHMTTFLSYLMFWQDVLDHCRSVDVKATLLDHFQILFLQQLLYPSLLQSSDTDGGSSVAVLTYLNVILESLDHPDLVHMILSYLLAIPETSSDVVSAPSTPVRPSMPPRSPTAAKRRQSLLLIAAPRDDEEIVEPTLFNLVDLVVNSIQSKNQQTVYAALRLTSTILSRQKRFAFSTLVRIGEVRHREAPTTIGALEVDVSQYLSLAAAVSSEQGIDEAYSGLCEDTRLALESQLSLQTPALNGPTQHERCNLYTIRPNDPLLRYMLSLLETFFTNSVDMNLSLTQALFSLALCCEVRLDGWLATDASVHSVAIEGSTSPMEQPWQSCLDEEEAQVYYGLLQAYRQPTWSEDKAPLLWRKLSAMAEEIVIMRLQVSGLDALLAGRKEMVRSAGLETSAEEAPSLLVSEAEPELLAVPQVPKGHSRFSSVGSSSRGRTKATNIVLPSQATSSQQGRSPAPSTQSERPSIFVPPPPETPSTTDVLMQKLTFPLRVTADGAGQKREASLNHVLTNIVILQEFILEMAAVLQVRAAVLGDQEVRFV